MKQSDYDSAEIAIVGPYPPPYGGFSVHVQRLLPLLAKCGVEARVYNGVGGFRAPPQIVNVAHRPLRSGLMTLVNPHHKVYYVLTTRTKVRFWAGLLERRGRRVILQVGGDSLRHSLASAGMVERWLARNALRAIWGIMAANSDIARMASFVRGSESRIWTIPAFLPPDETEDAALDPETAAFVTSHSPVILANGRFATHSGTDIYGVSDLLKATALLRREWPSAGLLFVHTRPEDFQGSEWPPIRKLMESLGVASHTKFVREIGQRGSLIQLMRLVTVFVRSTSTDGDACSVREALWVGLPVVASDCVARPAGTICYRTGDSDNLADKVRWTFANREELLRQLAKVRPQDNWSALQELFSMALGRSLCAAAGKPGT